MPVFRQVQDSLRGQPHRWLVTGGAGFIGSHLVESLLRLGQTVLTLDNFSTGHERNLDQVRDAVGPDAWRRHQLVKADVRDLEACTDACKGVDFVLHEAALGSVPRSLEDPLATNASNVTGFLNILLAARDARVKRFIYAASSSVYGDEPTVPKVEDKIGRPLSPYALTKYVNELYAEVFARCYGMETVGLRYFNVFGPRQDPEGPYAAVIPKWVRGLLTSESISIHGDGKTTRDFCYVGNVVQANLLAAMTDNRRALNQVYNVAFGAQTSLTELFDTLLSQLQDDYRPALRARPQYTDFRDGDVRHSLADISKAKNLLGFAPTHDLARGLKEALPWYVGEFASEGSEAQGRVPASRAAGG